MVNVTQESIVSTAMFFGYLTNNDMGSAKLMLLEAAKNWKQAFVDTQRKFISVWH